MGTAIGRALRRPRVVALAAVLLATAGAVGWWLWSRGETAQLLREGEAALAARDDAKARDLLAQYLARRPDDPRARLLAARAARRLRNYSEAREHLRRYREAGGEAEPADVEEALAAVQQGDEGPVPILRERTNRDDELALVVLEVLIQHDLDTYQLRSALNGFTRYLERRPDDLLALLGRGYVWERFLSFPDALADYRKAVEAHPENERARLKLAEMLLIAGTPAEAEEQFRWLAERRPDRPEVRLGLARCARRLGRPAEAAKLLDDLLAAYPEHGETLWERGELELDENRPAAAEPFLRRAAAKLPFDRRVHYALYRCLVRLDRPAEAEAVNARVAQLDADVRRLGQIQQEVLKRPNDPALRCEGGVIFLRNGERQQGIRWLQLALRLDPGYEPARAALAAETRAPKAP